MLALPHQRTGHAEHNGPMEKPPYLTAAFYRFVDLPDCEARRTALLAVCNRLGLRGLILLAREGINGTIAGAPEAVHSLLAFLRSDPALAGLQCKESYASRPPFLRMKVRIKKEIVTMQVAGLDAAAMAGTYVRAADWNALVSQPDVVLVDTRNTYETELGTFAGAMDPGIRSFAELPAWLDQQEKLPGGALNRSGKSTRIAMFCTGGIRCEKSTAYLRARGYDQVYHLEGGILTYLETMPREQSLWQGECFVFDERVSVGHGLRAGEHQLCRACRQPLPQGATESPLYEAGVSCPRCHASSSATQKDSARERQRQWELAKVRHQTHIGAPIGAHARAPTGADLPESPKAPGVA